MHASGTDRPISPFRLAIGASPYPTRPDRTPPPEDCPTSFRGSRPPARPRARQVDKLTDQMANGQATDTVLYAEWSSRLAACKAGAPADSPARAAPDCAMSETTSVRATRFVVRHRKIGSSGEAGTLTLRKVGGTIDSAGQIVPRDTTREIGHRSLRTFYRQHYRPEGDSLGATNPELAALMLQYARRHRSPSLHDLQPHACPCSPSPARIGAWPAWLYLTCPSPYLPVAKGLPNGVAKRGTNYAPPISRQSQAHLSRTEPSLVAAGTRKPAC